jgi:hypothetical protein
MRMSVDLESDSSRETGAYTFSRSCDANEEEEEEDEAETKEEDTEDSVEEVEEEQEEEEEEEEQYDDDDDDDNDNNDGGGDDGDDEDDDDDDDDDDGLEDDDDCDSNSSNILNVIPRDLHANHSSSTLDTSRICWPPGSCHDDDGTRKSAFQPYRVGSVVDTDTRIKKGSISAKCNYSEKYQCLFHLSSNFRLICYLY